MNTTTRVLRYELSNVMRGKWAPGYALFFLLATEGLLRFGGGGPRAMLSLTNVVLFIIPLVSTVFGTIYLYDARAFTRLLLAQPVNRTQLFFGLYLGLSAPLAAAFVVGAGTPFILRGLAGVDLQTLAVLLAAGALLTAVFTALAFVIALRFQEKVKGLAAAILLWLFFTILYDGLVLAAVGALAAFPLEKPMIGVMLLNPVDLARVLLLMHLDIAALMGYTGAVFHRFFGSGLGMAISLAALSAWLALPLASGLRSFSRKDF
jgi:Cu-processing system permease protein